MGKYRGLDVEEGWQQRRFAAIERALAEQAPAPRLVIATDFRQADLPNVELTPAWTSYLTQTIQVPLGYTSAIVQLVVSSGTTISGDISSANNGNIGVQPWVAGFAGAGLSQGKIGGGAVSVMSAMAIRIAVTPGGTFTLWANAYTNGTGHVPNSGNVHLSATILFVRE